MSEMEVDPPSVVDGHDTTDKSSQRGPAQNTEIERAKVPLYSGQSRRETLGTSEAVGPPYSEQMRLLFTQTVARVASIY